MNPAETTCPKCHYTRQQDDTAPADQCPKCGIIYAKLTPPSRPAATAVPAAWLEEKAQATGGQAPASPSSHLIDCPACSGQLSFQAQICPHCGNPNPDSPNRAGNTAGLIALTLAVSALWMPYFGAPLLIPAAIGAIIIAGYLRAHIAPLLLAAALVIFALIGVYQTSKEIRKAGEAIEKSSRDAEIEMQNFRRRMENIQRDLAR